MYLSNSERRKHWRHLTDTVTLWLFRPTHTQTHTHGGWLIGLFLWSTDNTVCFGASGAECVLVCVCERMHVCIRMTVCVYSHFKENVQMGWCASREEAVILIKGADGQTGMTQQPEMEKRRLFEKFSAATCSFFLFISWKRLNNSENPLSSLIPKRKTWGLNTGNSGKLKHIQMKSFCSMMMWQYCEVQHIIYQLFLSV